jgi:hypothetical protein
MLDHQFTKLASSPRLLDQFQEYGAPQRPILCSLRLAESADRRTPAHTNGMSAINQAYVSQNSSF